MSGRTSKSITSAEEVFPGLKTALQDSKTTETTSLSADPVTTSTKAVDEIFRKCFGMPRESVNILTDDT